MEDTERSPGSAPIPVIDLFAGPGGLNEGFSSIGEDEGSPMFQTIGSFEMDAHAVKTLTLRSVFRHLKRTGGVPKVYYDYISGTTTREDFEKNPAVAEALLEATKHVHEIELGKKTRSEVDKTIAEALETALPNEDADWVLIGGPPCQAYSMAGRSRRRNDTTFALDHKHFLYEEYLHIIARFRPAVFVMENVKGLLSSTNNGVGMFGQILHDLRHPDPGRGLTYEIRSLIVDKNARALQPGDFVIPAERYGVPQRRHRVILLGIRSDVVGRTKRAVLTETSTVSVRDAIDDLPPQRSRLSPARLDSDEAWSALRNQTVALRTGPLPAVVPDGTNPLEGPPAAPAEEVVDPKSEGLFEMALDEASADTEKAEIARRRYREWVEDPRVPGALQHESRHHMESDIKRYGYLAWKALELGRSPKFTHLPAGLEPNHKNIGEKDTPFMDRFRVQIWDSPSTTIVSHIAKDGHYYIHPDETQMRSLTVREAARLQTFPDNYFFEGTRTRQYHQVGNAVPPLLARLIAEKVVETLQLGSSGSDDEESGEQLVPVASQEST